jgi:hypothetical protein
MMRTLTIALRRRHWDVPRGATHVFQWLPPQLLTPSSPDPDDGLWELTPLADWLTGTRDDEDADGILGPSTAPEGDLTAFLWGEWGETVTLAPFSVQITCDGFTTDVPAYWVTRADV